MVRPQQRLDLDAFFPARMLVPSRMSGIFNLLHATVFFLVVMDEERDILAWGILYSSSDTLLNRLPGFCSNGGDTGA